MRYPSLTAEKEKAGGGTAFPSEWIGTVPILRFRKTVWRTAATFGGKKRAAYPAGAAGIRGDTVDDGGASPVFSGKCDPFFDVDDRREGWLGNSRRGSRYALSGGRHFTDEDGVSLRLGEQCRCILFAEAHCYGHSLYSGKPAVADQRWQLLLPWKRPFQRRGVLLGPEVYYPLAMTDGHGSATPEQVKGHL